MEALDELAKVVLTLGALADEHGIDPAGQYVGKDDKQLERASVYFNLVSGGVCRSPEDGCLPAHIERKVHEAVRLSAHTVKQLSLCRSVCPSLRAYGLGTWHYGLRPLGPVRQPLQAGQLYFRTGKSCPQALLYHCHFELSVASTCVLGCRQVRVTTGQRATTQKGKAVATSVAD